ncbi:MAG: site-specific integrase [Candidatus Nephthysia bennettiae]|uniref:Site-specific integrase n=1 Tax=Candidatus Nephthysia bennettiae TaxID=3127016 RepID=A0A934K5N8_9BACT|nr:site-specific integrase [Candidatus Dormibacteraeota bacterium]MBJ7612434.1 site-specific integrase [Candidatus Dormibacteraeota bacterium]PZR94307.1 MAG: site-specific integrase [Candidatus Dormibacteraeota bacterium]
MSRRGRGEGSIYRRQDGRWAATISLGWSGGRRRRKTFYGQTRAEVARALAAALRGQQLGQEPIAERQTVAEFLTSWLARARPGLRPRTYEGYVQLVRDHVVPDLGNIRLDRLGPQHLQDLLTRKLGEDLSPRTVQYVHAVLRAALGQALRWGLVARNVASLVQSPRVRQAEVRPLTPVEARNLLSAVKGERMEALYTVALALGLRQGEALGLQWGDIDLEARQLRVLRALQRRVDGRIELSEPKTRRSKRTIRMPEAVVVALREHRGRQRRDRLKAGESWLDEDFVFTDEVGRPLDGTRVTKIFQRVLVRAGLPRLRFHDLRHSAATLLLVQGVPARVVMETLGHSEVGITLNTYSHVVPILEEEAAAAMDRALGGGGGNR